MKYSIVLALAATLCAAAAPQQSTNAPGGGEASKPQRKFNDKTGNGALRDVCWPTYPTKNCINWAIQCSGEKESQDDVNQCVIDIAKKEPETRMFNFLKKVYSRCQELRDVDDCFKKVAECSVDTLLESASGNIMSTYTNDLKNCLTGYGINVLGE